MRFGISVTSHTFETGHTFSVHRITDSRAAYAWQITHRRGIVDISLRPFWRRGRGIPYEYGESNSERRVDSDGRSGLPALEDG